MRIFVLALFVVTKQHPGTGSLASPPRDDVAVVDLGTDRVRQLTHDASGKIRLSWSPGGAKLVYEVSRGPANLSLASIDADTGLATEPESVRPYPIWSPSSRRLAFVVIENERASLTIAAADGAAARVVFRGARDVGVDGVICDLVTERTVPCLLVRRLEPQSQAAGGHRYAHGTGS